VKAGHQTMQTAQRLVERSLRTWGDRVAVVDGPRRQTYDALAERTGRLAHVLLAAKASSERPAATLLPNILEFIEIDVACTRAGITRLGISDRLSSEECAYLLADSEAAVLVTTPALLESLEEQLPDSLELVLLVGETGTAAASRIATARYEDALSNASAAFEATPVAPETPNYILYTSGTTGRPKGATHTHAGRAASTLNMLASELVFGARPAVMVHAGPLTHGSGSKLISFLAAGGKNVILTTFNVETFARAVQDEGGTHTFVVPTMIQRFLEAGDEVVGAVAALDQISFGGSPISAALFRRAIERFGPILTQVYGSCEAPHPVTLLSARDYIDGTCGDAILTSAGRVSYGVDIRFADDEGRDVAPGELGELLIRADNVMSGYWRNEAATSEAFDGDGWYRSGDLATVDEGGFVTFQDRKRDLIISGGLNIYPSEVERVIASHPGVSEVAVIGAPDDEWGEAVVAYVVTRDGDLRGEEIIDWTRARLAHYKKPKHVVFLDRLPLGSSNKVLKRELRGMHWKDHERRVN
jgi:acyl-CoA synthetase (AMP-forming)/AMP-acid ligase II